ncbi:MAG: V-type ATP synthase subunit I [Oscillospiraceae bacterium]|nr:V-type ATP synthase subunit I [Oscillospiraceae bacterium]
MAITKMSLVRISGNVKYIDETMVKCCEFGMFHPERAKMLEEYEKTNEIFLDYSKNTGYLRKIVDLAGKLGLGQFKNQISDLEKFSKEDKIGFEDNISESEIETRAYSNSFESLLHKCEDIFTMLDIKLKDINKKIFENKDNNIEIENIDVRIDELKSKVEYLLKEKSLHEKKISEYTSVLTQLQNIDNANIDFDDLFSCKYLKIRFGRLPKESYEKLKLFDSEEFVFVSFKIDHNYSLCLYITPCYISKKIDEMFNSLFFERIRIPVYAHGTPDSTKHYVKDQINKYESALKNINLEIKNLKTKIEKDFSKIYFKIKFFSECFSNKKYAAIFEDKFYLVGFIPKDLEHEFVDKFNNSDSLNNLESSEAIDVTISDPTSDKRLKTPVKLKNNRFSRPFEDFVAMYGLPSYKDKDPTVFLSISYTVLFGIMFGDIGQGLVIALLGYLMAKIKDSNFGRILTRIGLSSAFFGVIYGSCFGFEDLFEKYILGLSDPYKNFLLKISHKDTNTLLLGAIFIGVIFTISSMIFNIVVGIKHKKSSVYMFGQNGLAGLVFYFSAILAVVGVMILKTNVLNPWFITFCIIIPIVLIFLKEPLGDKVDGREVKIHDGVGGFVIENFFELYDVLLGFMSNTISFIRVGAFVLSHAGMMMVVMNFVNNMQSYGKISMLIFGNIFVMAFEGLIVGIQVLRLQFYEMFSRCFDGAGKPFKKI